jgi:hypothetical protein
MDLVLSLQMLPTAADNFGDLTSSNSNTCSSASTGGCVITQELF